MKLSEKYKTWDFFLPLLSVDKKETTFLFFSLSYCNLFESYNMDFFQIFFTRIIIQNQERQLLTQTL